MNMRVLSDRIFELMEKKQIRQAQLSEQLGCSRQAISRWKTSGNIGKTGNVSHIIYIREKTLDSLAVALGCTTYYLTGKTTVPNGIIVKGEQLRQMDCPFDIRTAIMDRLRSYSYDQLHILVRFLDVFEVLNDEKLNSFVNKCISSLDSPMESSLEYKHPLNNWTLFKAAFSAFPSMLNKLENESANYFPRQQLPQNFKNGFSNCKTSLRKDYDALSAPLGSVYAFKKSMKFTQNAIKLFLEDWNDSTNPLQSTNIKLQQLYGEMITEVIDTALDQDIERFLKTMNAPNRNLSRNRKNSSNPKL